MIVGLEAAKPQPVTGLNDRLALAVEVDCTFPAVPGSELLTCHYHRTALTLPHKHTVNRVIYSGRHFGRDMFESTIHK